MPNNKNHGPEIALLDSILDDKLKEEEDAELKEIIKRKAKQLYPLLALLSTKDLDRDQIKKSIQLLIEEEA